MANVYRVTNNPQETQAIASEIAREIKEGGVVALYGELGAGKTTFAQGLARELGVKERIISPTFLIVRIHDLNNGKNFYHIDLYRLESEDELESIGISEILSNPGNVVVIEWAERARGILPKKRIDVQMRNRGELKREIEVIRHG